MDEHILRLLGERERERECVCVYLFPPTKYTLRVYIPNTNQRAYYFFKTIAEFTRRCALDKQQVNGGHMLFILEWSLV